MELRAAGTGVSGVRSEQQLARDQAPPGLSAVQPSRGGTILSHSEAHTATAAPMKMTDEVEAVMGGVRMGVNVDIKRTDGKD